MDSVLNHYFVCACSFTDLNKMILPKVSNQASPEDVVKELNRNGIVVIEDFCQNVESLKKEGLRILDEMGGASEYKFGRYAALRTQKEVAKHPILHSYFTQPFIKETATAFMGEKHYLLNALYITQEYNATEDLANNGHPHFDQDWSFKFFLYLTDVDEDSGAFKCIPGTAQKGKELREKSHKEVKKIPNIKNRILRDYEGLGYTLDDFIPVEGKAGTLIIFDSDTFHFGGNIKEGRERMVMRSHNTIESSNDLLSKMKKAFSGLINT